MTSTILDLFAGPGGWSTGLRILGIDTARAEIGVEWDAHAAATARKAGHRRLVADVAALDYASRTFTGVIASPPCQGFSMAGKGKGRADSLLLVEAVKRLTYAPAVTAGRVSDLIDAMHERMTDDRSLLALEPLRAVLATMPEWTCWEQVPAVLPLWEACADVLRAVGYDVETGNVQAEQFGVPQTRKRAILRAVRGRTLRPLVPTHSRYYSRQPGKLDLGVQPWVSMAQALGWGMTQRPSMTVTAGGTGAGGAEPFGNAARQGMHRELDAGRWQMASRRDSPKWLEENGPRENRTADRPSVTITGEAHRWAWQPVPAIEGETPESITWPYDRPSPTIVGSFAPDVVAAPGYRKAGDPPRQKTPGSVRVTVQEAAVLQSFPPDYPWQGTKTAQYRQVGDAVPPMLAAAVVASVLPDPEEHTP